MCHVTTRDVSAPYWGTGHAQSQSSYSFFLFCLCAMIIVRKGTVWQLHVPKHRRKAWQTASETLWTKTVWSLLKPEHLWVTTDEWWVHCRVFFGKKDIRDIRCFEVWLPVPLKLAQVHWKPFQHLQVRVWEGVNEQRAVPPAWQATWQQEEVCRQFQAFKRCVRRWHHGQTPFSLGHPLVRLFLWQALRWWGGAILLPDRPFYRGTPLFQAFSQTLALWDPPQPDDLLFYSQHTRAGSWPLEPSELKRFARGWTLSHEARCLALEGGTDWVEHWQEKRAWPEWRRAIREEPSAREAWKGVLAAAQLICDAAWQAEQPLAPYGSLLRLSPSLCTLFEQTVPRSQE